MDCAHAPSAIWHVQRWQHARASRRIVSNAFACFVIDSSTRTHSNWLGATFTCVIMQRHDDRRKQWIFHGLFFPFVLKHFHGVISFLDGEQFRTPILRPEFALEVYILPQARPQTDLCWSGAKWFAGDKWFLHFDSNSAKWHPLEIRYTALSNHSETGSYGHCQFRTFFANWSWQIWPKYTGSTLKRNYQVIFEGYSYLFFPIIHWTLTKFISEQMICFFEM